MSALDEALLGLLVSLGLGSIAILDLPEGASHNSIFS